MAKELKEVVGVKNIQDSEEVLESYSQDYSFAPKVRPRCVVKPKSAAEVQALIQWANDSATPLIPVSSGAPHFRGDTVPSIGGAVIVDLSGLKQVVRIDKRNRIAMIETGVTFGELIPQIEKAGLKLNLPLLPRANKSVIGSMLEREPVIMPLYQWDAIDPLTCIEVVFGTGDLFRTGSAAGPGTLEDQWKAKQAQVNPMYGPRLLDAMERGVTVEQVLFATRAAKRYGIEVGMFLMWGYDGETVDDIAQTVDLVARLRAKNVPVEQLVFPDDVHDFLLHRNWFQAYLAASDFFDRKLGNAKK